MTSSDNSTSVTNITIPLNMTSSDNSTAPVESTGFPIDESEGLMIPADGSEEGG